MPETSVPKKEPIMIRSFSSLTIYGLHLPTTTVEPGAAEKAHAAKQLYERARAEFPNLLPAVMTIEHFDASEAGSNSEYGEYRLNEADAEHFLSKVREADWDYFRYPDASYFSIYKPHV